jgi:hypothetical protein
MDGFELLRRAKDLIVGLAEADAGRRFEFLPNTYACHDLFCQFDKKTGWPVYGMKEDGGPLSNGICKIDETAQRGISVRQLLVMYELVLQRCVAEGWTNLAGELLTPETVTLYDINKYVIMPATEAHQCSYVELVTGAGEESARRCPDKHVPMARTKVYCYEDSLDAEEVSCTQCAKKLERGATYWVCHRCGDRHKLCGECAPAPAPVKCAKLQEPLWFVSHWYGRCRSLPRLANAFAAFETGGGSPSSNSSRASSSTHATGTTSPATTTPGSISSTGCAPTRTTSTRTSPSQQWPVPAIIRALR